MKKKRKLNLQKVKIAKIDRLTNIIGGRDDREPPYSTPGADCRSPSDTSPAGTNRDETKGLCVHGQGTGNECA